MPQFNLQINAYTLAEFGNLQDFEGQLNAIDFFVANLQDIRRNIVNSINLLPAFTADPTTAIPYTNPAAAGPDFQSITSQLLVDKFGNPFNPQIGSGLPVVETLFSPQAMTSNSQAPFTAFGSNADAFQLFDGNAVTVWLGQNDLANQPDYVGLLGDTARLIRAVEITAAGDANFANAPAAWKLQGSNDSTDGFNGNWLTVFEVSTSAAFAAGESRRYAVSTTSSFKHFRLEITQSLNANLVVLAGLKFFS
jgi:hypothetical protein